MEISSTNTSNTTPDEVKETTIESDASRSAMKKLKTYLNQFENKSEIVQKVIDSITARSKKGKAKTTTSFFIGRRRFNSKYKLRIASFLKLIPPKNGKIKNETVKEELVKLGRTYILPPQTYP